MHPSYLQNGIVQCTSKIISLGFSNGSCDPRIFYDNDSDDFVSVVLLVRESEMGRLSNDPGGDDAAGL